MQRGRVYLIGFLAMTAFVFVTGYLIVTGAGLEAIIVFLIFMSLGFAALDIDYSFPKV